MVGEDIRGGDARTQPLVRHIGHAAAANQCWATDRVEGGLSGTMAAVEGNRGMSASYISLRCAAPYANCKKQVHMR
jgi:hypothetical protein